MPYLDDQTGVRPWSDVINEVGGGIRSAIAQRQASDEKDQEKNRALHPATQKWLQRVMDGSMTPAQASVAAHSEIDSLGQTPPSAGATQAPDPSMMASGGKLGVPGQDQGQMPQAPAPQMGLRQAVAAPMPAPDRPMTVQDAGDLERLAPFAASQQRRSGTGVSESDAEARIRLKAEEERKTVDKKETGKDKRQGIAITSKENLAKKALDARAAEAVTKHEDKLAEIAGRLTVAIKNGESATNVAAIRSEAQLIASDDGSVAKELSSIMRDENVDEDTRRLAADANNRRAELRARVGSAQPVPSYGGPGAVQGPPEPGAMPAGGSPSTPDIPPVIPGLGVPPKNPSAPPIATQTPVKEPPAYGAPAPDPMALPPNRGGNVGKKASAPTRTGIFKIDKNGQKWEKMSDGTAEKVK